MDDEAICERGIIAKTPLATADDTTFRSVRLHSPAIAWTS